MFTGFGAIVLILAAFGLISVTSLNMYGGSLTLISAIDSFGKVRPTLTLRAITVGFTAALSLIGALFATKDFLGNFNNFLLLILYLFIPWTAVNLVDYYVVRRGHYAIAEIFNPHGMYGRWGWRGLAAYLLGFAAMVPFFNASGSAGTLFEGVAAKALDGADISFFVGLPIAGNPVLAVQPLDRRRRRDRGRAPRGGRTRDRRARAPRAVIDDACAIAAAIRCGVGRRHVGGRARRSTASRPTRSTPSPA